MDAAGAAMLVPSASAEKVPCVLRTDSKLSNDLIDADIALLDATPGSPTPDAADGLRSRRHGRRRRRSRSRSRSLTTDSSGSAQVGTAGSEDNSFCQSQARSASSASLSGVRVPAKIARAKAAKTCDSAAAKEDDDADSPSATWMVLSMLLTMIATLGICFFASRLLGYGGSRDVVSELRPSVLPSSRTLAKTETKLEKYILGNGEVAVRSMRPPTIFMMWSTPESTFRLRNYRVIDSYLFHDPEAHIVIYATHLTNATFAAYTAQGYRITVVNATDTALRELAAGCPGAAWMEQAAEWRSRSPYFYSHLTDYVRFCALYRFGGVYSDFDAVQLRRLAPVGSVKQPQQSVSMGDDDEDNDDGDEGEVAGARAFIGRDSSGAKGSCGWCLEAGDIYLAPGVMGAPAGHDLVRRALEVAFESGSYNPDVFNGVGPIAVTTAYRDMNSQERTTVDVLDRHVLYPYSYQDSWKVFKAATNGSVAAVAAAADVLARRSTSLHLYGHMTRNVEIEPGSVLDMLLSRFTLAKDPVSAAAVATAAAGVASDDSSSCDAAAEVHAPDFIAAPRYVAAVAGVRVVAPCGTARLAAVLVEAERGMVRLAGNISEASVSAAAAAVGGKDGGNDAGGDGWSRSLRLEGDTPAELNGALARLMFRWGPPVEWVDWITVTLYVESGGEMQRGAPAQAARVRIPAYNVNAGVTIMIKTLDRITKVFRLVESILERYPTISIVVANDGARASLVEGEGYKRGFYYLPLPFDVGLSAGRNRMVERAATEYVLTLDDDFVFDEGSSIESLLHALEMPDTAGRVYDIAAGKNPDDETRFGLDFCGIMRRVGDSGRTLWLGPTAAAPMVASDVAAATPQRPPPSHAGCDEVEFVPNLFLARRRFLLEQVRWDELLKLGEHEDFFLRARAAGARTLTCAGVRFRHEQVAHWRGETEYDRMRGRVFDFLRLSLRKHGLTKLVSFGRVMMDLTIPPRIEALKASEVLSHTATLHWESSAFAFKVLQSSDGGTSWGPVNYGQGEMYEPDEARAASAAPAADPEGPRRAPHAHNRIVVFGLRPATEYQFRVQAGNRFDFEPRGRSLRVRTLTLAEQGADSETGHRLARSQVTTVGYMYGAPSVAALAQAVPGARVQAALATEAGSGVGSGGIGSDGGVSGAVITLAARSRVDRIFDEHPSWRVELRVWMRRRAAGLRADMCDALEPLVRPGGGGGGSPTATSEAVWDNADEEISGGAYERQLARGAAQAGQWADERLVRRADASEVVEFDRS
ncbi:Beta-1,4 N-acetylgalactosaminyltransferase 2, partial [Cladochytrium tenue]